MERIRRAESALVCLSVWRALRKVKVSWLCRSVRRSAERIGNERWRTRAERRKLQVGSSADKAERARLAGGMLLKRRIRWPPEAC